MRPLGATPSVGIWSAKSQSRFGSPSLTLTGWLQVAPSSAERAERIWGTPVPISSHTTYRSPVLGSTPGDGPLSQSEVDVDDRPSAGPDWVWTWVRVKVLPWSWEVEEKRWAGGAWPSVAVRVVSPKRAWIAPSFPWVR